MKFTNDDVFYSDPEDDLDASVESVALYLNQQT